MKKWFCPLKISVTVHCPTSCLPHTYENKEHNIKIIILWPVFVYYCYWLRLWTGLFSLQIFWNVIKEWRDKTNLNRIKVRLSMIKVVQKWSYLPSAWSLEWALFRKNGDTKKTFSFSLVLGTQSLLLNTFLVVHKLRWQARGRGICQMSTLVNEGGGDQRLVNVDKFELFIRLINSNTKQFFWIFF